jgi:predicted glutamine amidotransferase
MTILWFLLFSLIVSYFSDRTILACGIWGWSGSNPALFNADKFNILGMFNDSRGGDASGKFIDRILYRGVDGNAEYKNLIKAFPTIGIKENTVAIGHARKASIGAKTMDNAQPFYIKHKNDKGEEKTLGVFMHNGTITNIKELCTKHGVTYDHSLSDSFHLGYLLFTVGTKILAEYTGTAACIWIPWSNRNVMYMFRGESKATKWATVMSDERPLYIYKDVTPKGVSYWVSSMMDSLESAFQVGKKNTEQVKYLNTNTIFKLYKDQLTISERIDRSKVVFEEVKIPTQSTFYPSQHRWENDYSVGRKLNWLNEETMNMGVDTISFYRGRYWINEKLAHGTLRLEQDGKLGITGRAFYFIKGIMIRDYLAYKDALSEFALNTYPYKNFIEDILPYTDCAVSISREEDKDANGWIKVLDTTYKTVNSKYFSGTFAPLFSSRRFTCSTGDITHIRVAEWNTYDDEPDREELAKEITDAYEQAYLVKACDMVLDTVLQSIQEAQSELDTLEPKLTNVLAPYAQALEEAEECLYQILDTSTTEDAPDAEADEVDEVAGSARRDNSDVRTLTD